MPKYASVNVGQEISSSLASGSAVSLTTNTAANLTSISLTPGDWEVSGVVYFTQGGSTVPTYYVGAIHTTSGTLPGTDTGRQTEFSGAQTSVAKPSLVITPTRLSITSNTTVYLIAQAGFTVSTQVAYGRIKANLL